MDQMPAQGAGRAEAQLTLPASGLERQALSFLLPIRPGLGGRGGGWASQKAMGWIRPSSTQSCNFSFGFPGLCTQLQPRGPAPEGVAVRVSAEQAEALDFILFFYVPLSLDSPRPAPWTPPPSRSPASKLLAQSQPLSRAAGEGMGAETQGQGRGGLRLWGPLCTGRPSPTSNPHPPSRLLSAQSASTKSSDPWLGELHFRTPWRLPVVSSPKPPRRETDLPAGVTFALGPGAGPSHLQLRRDLKLTMA